MVWLQFICYSIIALYFAMTLGKPSVVQADPDSAAKIYMQQLHEKLDSFEEDFAYLYLTEEQSEELKSHIYTLKKRLQSMNPRDSYEWISLQQDLELSYQDLLRNLHNYNIINSANN